MADTGVAQKHSSVRSLSKNHGFWASLDWSSVTIFWIHQKPIAARWKGCSISYTPLFLGWSEKKKISIIDIAFFWSLFWAFFSSKRPSLWGRHSSILESRMCSIRSAIHFFIRGSLSKSPCRQSGQTIFFDRRSDEKKPVFFQIFFAVLTIESKKNSWFFMKNEVFDGKNP